RIVELLLRHDFFLEQLRSALLREASLRETDLVLLELAPRRSGLCLRERERRTRRRVVQASEHLPLGDVAAFLDIHFGHLAGDLRGDRRAAARRDVAGRIEDGSLRARRAGRDGRDLHLDRTFTREPAICGEAERRDEDEQTSPEDPAAEARTLGLALDPQCGEVVLEISHANWERIRSYLHF